MRDRHGEGGDIGGCLPLEQADLGIVAEAYVDPCEHRPASTSSTHSTTTIGSASSTPAGTSTSSGDGACAVEEPEEVDGVGLGRRLVGGEVGQRGDGDTGGGGLARQLGVDEPAVAEHHEPGPLGDRLDHRGHRGGGDPRLGLCRRVVVIELQLGHRAVPPHLLRRARGCGLGRSGRSERTPLGQPVGSVERSRGVRGQRGRHRSEYILRV